MKPSIRRCLCLVSAFAAAAVTSLGGQVPARPTFDRKALEIAYQKFVLDNGLTLLVHTDHAVPVVGVNLYYAVGSRNEKPGKTGFAHLFEHFFFNGSQHHPGGFREAMDDLGANNRATISPRAIAAGSSRAARR